MKKNTFAFAITGSALVGTLILAGTAFAQTSTAAPAAGQQGAWQGHAGAGRGAGMKPGVFGTVSAVSGDSVTITSKAFARPGSTSSTATPPAPTTYTVDASGATVVKNGATSTVSSIAVGDTLMVQGTVSGTSVTATTIRDSVMPMMGGKGPGANGQKPPMSSFQGNGQPIVGGTISAISGSTLTLTNKSNVTYTVDASSATVQKDNATSTLSAVAVGDNVLVQGTINGSSVTATAVLDQGAPKTSTSGTPGKGFMGGIIGGISGFLQHIFGFF